MFVVKRLREDGAQRVVVGGASLGAKESLYALSQGLDADGLIWSPGSICTRASPSRSRCVAFGSRSCSGELGGEAGDLLRVFEQKAAEPNDVVSLDTGEHGTDILAYADVAVADQLREGVLDFLARI